MLKELRKGANRYGKVFLLLFSLLSIQASAQVVYYHDFGTSAITAHPYTVAPGTLNANLSSSLWTNTRNAWTSFAGSSGQAIALTNSSGTPVVTLTFNVAPQKQLDITGFGFWTQRSTAGAQNWTMRINNTVVGNGTVPTAGIPAVNTPVQNPVTGLTGTVTVTLTLSGATGAGTWRLDDFTLYGTVTNTCTPPVINSFSPANAPVNSIVTITGSGFATGTTAVLFNGTAASSYQVVSDTQIKAVVPATGTSGIVKVTTNNCTGESTGAFTYITSNCPGIANGTDLFISEVYDADAGEGGAIELYNPTASPINLSQYMLRKFRDANASQGTAPLQLVGTVLPGQVYLVGKKNNNIAVCGITSSVELVDGFNDRDEFVLLKNNVVIDDVICPTQTGFSMYRNFDAVKPKVTYSGADWNTLLVEQCTDLGFYNIPTTPQASFTAQPQDTAVCANATATFSATVQNAATGYTYQWKVLDDSGNWVNVVNNATYSGAQTATLSIVGSTDLDSKQYYLEVTSATCTIVSNAASLTVNAAPAIPVAVVVQPTCTNPVATITITPIAGVTYSFDNIAFNVNNSFTMATPGTYTISVKNAAGCITSSTVTINTIPIAPATPTAIVTQPTCTNTIGTITIDTASGLTYSFDGSAYSANNVFTTTTPGTYTISVKNAAGCITSSTVTINTIPIAPATPTATVTQPTCANATATITIDTAAGLTYSFDGSAYGTNNIFTTTVTGTHTISVQNANGCTASATVTVNAVPNAPATPTATVTQPTCTNTTATITIATAAGLTYSFDGSAYGTNNIFTTTVTGAHTISVQNTDGCTASATVTVNAVPNAPAMPTATVTQPTCTNTTATITIATAAGLTYSFDGSAYGTNNIFTTTVTGAHTISVQNTDGCTASATVTVNAVPNAPATPTATVTQPTCSNTMATITIATAAGLTYSFDGSAYGTNNIFTTTVTGAHTISVQNTDGCTASATVTVNAVPNAPATPTAVVTQPTCSNTSATITIATATGLTYSFNGSAYGVNNVFTIAQAGTYTISVQNAAGCIASSTITVNAAPVLPILGNQSGCVETPNGMEYLFIITTGDTTLDLSTFSYEWKDDTNNKIVSSTGPEFNVSEYVATNNIRVFPLKFTVTITTPQGCTLIFNPSTDGTLCDIPRGISPNGDSLNDEFDLSGMDVRSISIFNRYGLEVYKKGAYIKEWHGQTDSGHDLPTGTYFYVVKTADKTKTGWVYINREVK